MTQKPARMPSRRTQVVLGAFFFVIPCALFILQLGSNNAQSGVLLTKLAPIQERPTQDIIIEAIDENALWDTIVIHHLGQPAGTPEELDRLHRNSGLSGLGYHFLIGNGNGFGNGDVHIGYRWLNQLAGARPVDVDTRKWSDGTISICLVGNGNMRQFTEQQLLHLSHLVQRLQLELSIPPNNVLLAHEMSSGASSPGTYFAEGQFRSQLLDIPSIAKP
tara:strand:- start:3586 stop:4242 length:657 start_codon:yes stop_codon:yes gene_type:complete